MTKRTDYPTWAYRTFRKFQRTKRKDLRGVRSAVEQLRMGVAYVPTYKENFSKLEAALVGLETATKPANWK